MLADMIAEASQDSDMVDQAVKDKNESLMLNGKEPMDEATEAKFREEEFDSKRFKLKYYEDDSKFGTFSILSSKYADYMKLQKLANDGEVEVEFNGKISIKKVQEKDRKAAQAMVLPMQLFMLGLLPADVSSVNRYVYKSVEKKAMTENQYEKLKDVKSELGKKDLSTYEEYLVRTNRKKDGVIGEIEFVERFGGLTGSQEDEYVKLMERKGDVNYPDLKALQSGRTADDIIKKGSN
jgi:hypothetical protein